MLAERAHVRINQAVLCGDRQASLERPFRGGVRSTGEVAIQFTSNHNGAYTMTVADNGIGVPPDVDVAAVSSSSLGPSS